MADDDTSLDAEFGVDLESIRVAASRIEAHIERTPCVHSKTLSAQLGCELYIKFENLQFTASFKERGALNSLLTMTDRGLDPATGVIAMSAGNHAQALAYHGQRLGIPTTIVMPRFTPNAKVQATRVFGAEVILEGNQFEATRTYTLELAKQRGLQLIHPFDEATVIAGQGTVGLEVLDQVPGVDVVVVPIGGGGLMGGTACAIKSLRPQVQMIGVQMQRFAGAMHVFHETPQPASVHHSTVAEGIAVKRPGTRNLSLIRRYVDDVISVDEAQVEQAIFDLLEIEKTVAEGAGAAPLALLRAHAERFAGQRVVMVLSGGNIDMMILSSVLQRGLVRSNQLVRLQVEIPDTPGALAELTTILGELDSNIMEINHQRAFAGSSVRATMVELVLQMRGEEQQDSVMRALRAQGYEVREMI